MQAALAQAHQRFGALHGVVHAAGHADSGMLSTRTRDSVERTFAPKLRGTRLLLDLLGTLDMQAPDFVLLCSSISSLTAGDRKSTRLNSSHSQISYAVFCLKKKKEE